MAQSSTTQTSTNPQKRNASAAGMTDGKARAVKRRASKACQCCRARKVRCNVVEHGAPCTNCRLDEVECIVTEGKRRKKFGALDMNKSTTPARQDPQTPQDGSVSDVSMDKFKEPFRAGELNPLDGLAQPLFPPSPEAFSYESDDQRSHVPHMIYQAQGQHLDRRSSQSGLAASTISSSTPSTSVPAPSTTFYPQMLFARRPANSLPAYIQPLPRRIENDDIEYLEKKGALTVPDIGLRNELLRSYVEYVHPYMPLLDLHDFLNAIEANDGTNRISLFLFQAVMFAGTAYVDIEWLKAAGYETRKAARKIYFQKARLLYDFDYEIDRIALVQALLLMTYWYETPDDQKDTWHWMGVAISLAHTIGLHRNPDKTNMDPKRRCLWKRMWWSCFMRDRLIALGMRRPTRIKSEDFDVPMLELDDFQFQPIPEEMSCLPTECRVARDVDQIKQLAVMCIQKAKLCLCISHVLAAQYSVLSSHPPGVSTATTMMLVPKKTGSELDEIESCDTELQTWFDEMPDLTRYSVGPPQNLKPGDEVLFLHRGLLNMVYWTTISALHRPQVLPSGSTEAPNIDGSLREVSRDKVRQAAREITRIARDLQRLELIRFLPTTGVTVLLPAIIIHLLDIKSSNEEVRRNSLHSFLLCMQAMQRLREIYASADFGTQFLEAAIRKAGIQLQSLIGFQQQQHQQQHPQRPQHQQHHSQRSMSQPQPQPIPKQVALTPPPDVIPTPSYSIPDVTMTDHHPSSLIATTPPQSDQNDTTLPDCISSTSPSLSTNPNTNNVIDNGGLAEFFHNFNDPSDPNTMPPSSLDFDLLINMDHETEDLGNLNLFTESGDGIGVPTNLQGESSGFTLDMEWIKGMHSSNGGSGGGGIDPFVFGGSASQKQDVGGGSTAMDGIIVQA
ncbi:MAG: hypothetical protein M1834_003897 [Cirrosporium novae-zelandiae]|nr:MAG: hypothetical protein M1834_003897 [Cirrosporium novae-zelandiae]